MKPVLIVERALRGEVKYEDMPCRPPHCDARILHKPEECKFCSDAKELQEERERLDVSNTGHQNRKWPCPAGQARSAQSLNSWHGNIALTEDDLKREQAGWDAFTQEILDSKEPK